MARVYLQPAFVLHMRHFRDTSLLVDLFTLQQGRITAIAHGAHRPKSMLRGFLSPFMPLLVSWSGKSDLVNLGKVEVDGSVHGLYGVNLLSGFYLNELLMRFLHKYDSHPKIYSAYQQAVTDLQADKEMETVLRLFEKELLAEIGYGLQLVKDVNGDDILAEKQYSYIHEKGFVCNSSEDTANVFLGKNLLALYSEKLDVVALKDAKRLMRLVFAHLLGDRPLKSRELFV